jgi:hypothetical protein
VSDELTQKQADNMVGKFVFGECGQGIVVAATTQWCVYKQGDHEYAENWSTIRVWRFSPP